MKSTSHPKLPRAASDLGQKPKSFNHSKIARKIKAATKPSPAPQPEAIPNGQTPVSPPITTMPYRQTICFIDLAHKGLGLPSREEDSLDDEKAHTKNMQRLWRPE